MVGTAVRKVLFGTAAAIVLLGSLSACALVNPNATASATPSATASPTPSPTPTVTATPTPTPTASATGLGALSGAWKGTWTNETPTPAVGTFTLTWAQQGTLLVGAIGVTGSNCIAAGNVTGNVDGSKISFGAVEGTKLITYVGTVSGNTMSGTYSSDCGPSKGTWTAIKA
jgi:hypothetical protein